MAQIDSAWVRASDAPEPLRDAYETIEKIEKLLCQLAKSRPGCYIRNSPSDGYWSPECFQLMGLDVAQKSPPPKIYLSRLLPSDGMRVFAETAKACREKKVLETEYRVRLPDGSIRILSSAAKPVCGPLGYDSALVGVMRDITDERQALANILTVREQLRCSLSPHEGLALSALPHDEIRPSDTGQACWKAIRGGASPWLVKRILKLIEERFATGLTVKEMAQEVRLSVTHFSRLFKQATGETPHQFLLRWRLEQASQAMIHYSSKKISSIAVECGFFDQSHFTRHFRKKFGMTPGQVLRSAFKT